jgi:hypothetical protein
MQRLENTLREKALAVEVATDFKQEKQNLQKHLVSEMLNRQLTKRIKRKD